MCTSKTRSGVGCRVNQFPLASGAWPLALRLPRHFADQVAAFFRFRAARLELGARHALGVDVYHRRAPAEAARRLRHDVGRRDRSGVDAHLFRAGLDQGCHIVDRANAPAHRERHEALLGDAPHHVVHDVPRFVAGGDVEEDQFVGAGFVVLPGDLDGIARIAQLHEVHALDHPAGVNIQAGNDAVSQHGGHCRATAHRALKPTETRSSMGVATVRFQAAGS